MCADNFLIRLMIYLKDDRCGWWRSLCSRLKRSVTGNDDFDFMTCFSESIISAKDLMCRGQFWEVSSLIMKYWLWICKILIFDNISCLVIPDIYLLSLWRTSFCSQLRFMIEWCAKNIWITENLVIPATIQRH